MKMKKGISLVMLTVIILMMVILTTTVTVTGTNAINTSKTLKFSTEIAYVQELVDSYSNSKNGEYPVKDKVEVNLSKVTLKAISQFEKETRLPDSNAIHLYEIDFSLLGKVDISLGHKTSQTDIYAVSKETGKVYYVKGYKIGNQTYFTLTDELKKTIDYESSVNSVSKDGVIFTPSKTTWTNQNVNTTVKVPDTSEYQNIVVKSILQNGSFSTFSQSRIKKGYKYFEITGVTGNYEIEVTYSKNGNPSKQTYSITNFDNVSPTMNIVSTQSMVNQNDNVKQSYIKIDILTDISGIKYTKYETDNISTNQNVYFKDKGMQVNDNTIIVDRYTRYVTVYCEDSAGNWVSKLVTLNVVVDENDYIKDGLISLLDGTNNTGNGHNPSSTVWKDLSGNGNDGRLNSFQFNNISGWESNGLKFNNSNVLMKELNYPNITIETVARLDDTNNTNEITLAANYENGGYGIEFERDVQKIAFNVYTNGKYSTIRSDVITRGDINAFTMKYDGKNLKATHNDKMQTLTSNYPVSYPQNNTIFSLGGNPYGNDANKELIGTIYSVRIYNRALTDEETKQNYKIDKLRFGI